MASARRELAVESWGLSFESPLKSPVYKIELDGWQRPPRRQVSSTPLRQASSTRRRGRRPLVQSGTPLAELFGASSSLNKNIRAKQRETAFLPTWQHRLLYRPRQYSHDNTFAFYQRLAGQFSDSWCNVQPVIDDSGNGVCAILLLPFALRCGRVSERMVTEFADTHGYNTLQTVLGSSLAPNKPADCPKRDGFGWFFGMPSAGFDCRLVRRQRQYTLKKMGACRRRGATREAHSASTMCSTSASQANAKPEWFESLMETVRANEVMAVASKECSPRSDSDLGPEKMQVIIMFGGKDMLCLDWLPNLSRMYHVFATRATLASESFDSTYVFNTTVLLMEYPGYGFNIGPSTVGEFRRQSFATIDRLVEHLGAQQTEVSIVGYSLGCGMAIEAAHYLEREYRGPTLELSELLLIASPTNIAECATHLLSVPRFFESLVAKVMEVFDREDLAWDNYEGLSRLVADLEYDEQRTFRLHFVHGSDDALVKPRLSQALLAHVRREIERSDRLPADAKTHLLRNVCYTEVPQGTHWSVIGDPEHLVPLYDALYKPYCILK